MNTFDGHGKKSDRVTTKIRDLLNDWLAARDGVEFDSGHPDDVDLPPDPIEASRIEAKLHSIIKTKAPNAIFNFYGLAVAVCPTTPAGRVECREMVCL